MHTKRIDTPKEKESEFPKLMISKKSGVILLAIGAPDKVTLRGVIVESNTDHILVGQYTDAWDKASFSDYPGQVILSNHKIDE